MFLKKKGMAPEERGMAWHHAKTGWGMHEDMKRRSHMVNCRLSLYEASWSKTDHLRKVSDKCKYYFVFLFKVNHSGCCIRLYAKAPFGLFWYMYN